MFGGNQGYQLDGELVKAGLIPPLDEYAKAYGWDKSYTPETLQQFEWTDDGQTFGEGTLWGVAQTGQSVGVFANMAKLDAAGVDPASLETFDDFDAALAKLRESLPGRRAGDRARQQGPVRRAPPLGRDPGRLHAGAGRPRLDLPARTARRSTRGQPHRAREAQGVGGQGLPRQGRRVQRAQRHRGGVAFGKGKGALLIAGNWNAATAKDGLGEDAAFFNMPPGESGDMVDIGSTSFPMHISAKTEAPDLAAAYLD